MQTEFEPSADVIAMNLTIAAVESWMRTGVSELRAGEDVGREVGAIYREIHAAVSETAEQFEDPEDEDFDDDDDDDEGAEEND